MKKIFINNQVIIFIIFLMTSCGEKVNWSEEKANFKLKNDLNDKVVVLYNGNPFTGRINNIEDLSYFYNFEVNGVKSYLNTSSKIVRFKNGKLDGSYTLIGTGNKKIYDIEFNEGEEIEKIKYDFTKEEENRIIDFLIGNWSFDYPPNEMWTYNDYDHPSVSFYKENDSFKYSLDRVYVRANSPIVITRPESRGDVKFKMEKDEIFINLEDKSTTKNYTFVFKFPESIVNQNFKMDYLKKSIDKQKEILLREGMYWNTKDKYTFIFMQRFQDTYFDDKLHITYIDKYIFNPIRLSFKNLEGNKVFIPGETKF